MARRKVCKAPGGRPPKGSRFSAPPAQRADIVRPVQALAFASCSPPPYRFGALVSDHMADLSERVRTSLAGHYAIERELGRGGMATVYLAEDVKRSEERRVGKECRDQRWQEG